MYKLKMVYLNLWSLLHNYDKVLSDLCELKEKNCISDIIFLCETFLVDMKVPLCEIKECVYTKL